MLQSGGGGGGAATAVPLWRPAAFRHWVLCARLLQGSASTLVIGERSSTLRQRYCVGAPSCPLIYMRDTHQYQNKLISPRLHLSVSCSNPVGLSDNSVELWDHSGAASAPLRRCRSTERCLLYSLAAFGDSPETLRFATTVIDSLNLNAAALHSVNDRACAGSA